MSELAIQLLGPLSVTRAGAADRPLELAPRAQSLLVYLACTTGASRAGALALLWPGRSEDAARNALRQCLHQLRRVLSHDDGLQIEGERLSLQSDRVTLDLARFTRLAGSDQPQDWLEAARMYRGDLADGLIAGEPEFEQWLMLQRERLRAMAAGLAERLAEHGDNAEQRGAAGELARRLLVGDPLHEGCWRALMRAHERAGLRAKALQVWEECRATLRNELGVEPSTQTRALRDRLQDDGGIAPRSLFTTQVSRSLAQFAPPALAAQGATAQDLVLCGWQLLTQGRADANHEARRCFEAASAMAPDFSEALCLVGWSHLGDFLYGWSEDTAYSFAQAEEVADMALQRHPEHPSPHLLNGKLLLWRQRVDAALREVRRGLGGAPTSAYAHYHAAEICMWSGRSDEALHLARQALQLDPNDHGHFATVEAMALLALGHTVEALGVLESATTRCPAYCMAHGAHCVALVEVGELDAARVAARRARHNNRRISIDFARHRMPFVQARLRARFVSAWQCAGMPQREGAPNAVAAG